MAQLISIYVEFKFCDFLQTSEGLYAEQYVDGQRTYFLGLSTIQLTILTENYALKCQTIFCFLLQQLLQSHPQNQQMHLSCGLE